MKTKERKGRKMLLSDCCGVPVIDDIAHLELCPCCWEHCDVIDDEKIGEEN